jgi:hypothetical protein
MSDNSTITRIARCGCGDLSVTCTGEPADVYACSCITCQQLTGAAFSYCALFPPGRVSVNGERRYWRREGDSGRWIGRYFCPTCATTICFDFEALPGYVGVPAGCFGDSAFAAPTKVYWASRKHHWVSVPGATLIDTQ